MSTVLPLPDLRILPELLGKATEEELPSLYVFEMKNYWNEIIKKYFQQCDGTFRCSTTTPFHAQFLNVWFWCSIMQIITYTFILHSYVNFPTQPSALGIHHAKKCEILSTKNFTYFLIRRKKYDFSRGNHYTCVCDTEELPLILQTPVPKGNVYKIQFFLILLCFFGCFDR